MTSKTIVLTGAEIRADYSGGTNAWLRNDGTATVYASTAPGVTAGADGTVSIPAGQSVGVYGANGTVYLMGIGSVQLIGSDYTACPFKTSAQSGGSGADDVARAAIEAHAGNADIHISAAEKASWDGKADETDFTDHKNDTTAHVTADEKGNWNAKAELSDIPTTLPANGGNADTLGGISASELKRVAGAVMGGASAGVQWAGVDCQKGDVHTRMQVDADYDRILLFKSTDGGTSWEEIPLGNADTVDGKHVDDFAQQRGYTSDCDEAIAFGTYDISPDSVNAPTPNYYLVKTEPGSSGIWVKQTAMQCDTISGNPSIWNRLCVNGTWSSWVKEVDGTYIEEKLAALEARIAALEGK